MFHTYVQAHTKRMVDIDRASFLMDKELLQQAIKEMEYERDHEPRPDATYGAQWVWDRYISLHWGKYDAPFAPNVDPHWDE